MSEMIYRHKTGFVLIESSVENILNSWRQYGRKKEAGGVLIGYRRSPHIHVTACTTPYSKDKRKSYEFLRKDPRHMSIARRHWKESAGKAYYLGEWHTHPVNTPTPSLIDLFEWRKLKKSKFGEELLFVIVGLKKWYVQYNNTQVYLIDENVSERLF